VKRCLGLWLDSQTLYDLSSDYFSDLHGCYEVWLAYQNGVLMYYFSGLRLPAIDRAQESLSNFHQLSSNNRIHVHKKVVESVNLIHTYLQPLSPTGFALVH